MNKLILFCLFGAALVALTYAEEDKEERSLLEVAAGSRVVREARRRGLKGGKGKKARKARKAKKAKKARKAKKAKKARKAKKSKRKGGKKGGKKNKNKKRKNRTRKNKKKNNKKRKNKKRNNKNRNNKQADCMTDACMDSALDAMKVLGSKMVNFNKQKKRIETTVKQMANKAAKKDLFTPLISALREAGGGNASNLLCNGAAGAGADKLVSLSADLSACADNINASCSTDLPTFDDAAVEACSADFETFSGLAEAAMDASGAEACTLWQSEDLATATADVKAEACDIKSINDEFVEAKTACKDAFKVCRKLEDEVSAALSACSPANSVDAIKAAIVQGVVNTAAAAKVSAKIATATARSSARADTSCSAFAVEVVVVSGAMAEAPLLAALADMLNAIVALTVAECSVDEKAELTAAGATLEEAVAVIEDAIAAQNELLLVATGSTVSVDDITTPAPATTVAEEASTEA